MKNLKVCIVIPEHKSRLDDFEKRSLNRCIDVYSKYCEIKIACPTCLNQIEFQENTKYNLQFDVFQDRFFSGYREYNKFMLDSEFYGRFLEYEYILVYQLDGYVYKDNLDEWCNKGYDYIGAPWCFLCKGRCGNGTSEYVGNGGVSLRKTDKFYNLFLNRTIDFDKNEDTYFSSYFNHEFRQDELKKPTCKEASLFSLECDADTIHNITNEIPTFSHQLQWRNKRLFEELNKGIK